MNFIKKNVKFLLERLLRTNGIDLKLIRFRLDSFSSRHAEISAILSLEDSPGPPD